MIAVSDSSPLITLARIDCFDLIPKLFGSVCVSAEVYDEVVIVGAGLRGAAQASTADWIVVTSVQDAAGLAAALAQTGLGRGEVSAVVLAKELAADVVLIDEWKARRYAREQGLSVIGCIGILEELYEQGELSDLRAVYRQLIEQKTRLRHPDLGGNQDEPKPLTGVRGSVSGCLLSRNLSHRTA